MKHCVVCLLVYPDKRLGFTSGFTEVPEWGAGWFGRHPADIGSKLIENY
jgi:hypothetical protein